MNFARKIHFARENATKPISQLAENISTELTEYTDTFNVLYARYFNVVELITPTNAAEEKEKFLKCDISDVVDPVFRYNTEKLNAAVTAAEKVSDLLTKISGITPQNTDETFYLELLKTRLEDAILTGNIAKSILDSNDLATSQNLIKKFGLPEKKWIDKAWIECGCLKGGIPSEDTIAPHILGFLTPKEREQLELSSHDALVISRAFQRVAAFYGFKMRWQFPISDTATACDVRSASFDYNSPAMVVPTTRKCNGLKLLELIGHEVEEHMRQEENGDILFAGLGNAMMKGDETHLEGIAKISDINFSAVWTGKVVGSPAPWYILAIEHAHSGHGFADTARHLYQLIRDTGKTHKQAMATAWTAAFRAKRGNTSNLPGYVQPKDAGYLIGYHMAREVESGGLGQYLDMGCFSTDWIIRIASEYRVEPGDIPFPRRDAARRYFEQEMSTEW